MASAVWLLLLYVPAIKGFDLIPSNETDVVVGQSLVVRYLQTFSNLTNCTVQIPGFDFPVVLEEGQEGNPKYWGSGYVEGECGVLLSSVNKSNDGHWILTAKADFGEVSQVLTVNVKDDFNPTSGEASVGDEMNVTVGPTESAYCILKNPLGETTRLKDGKCRWTATRRDAGRWKVLYSVPGNLREEEMEYTLTALPSGLLTSETESPTVKGGRDILCVLPSDEDDVEPLFCRLIHPNGTGLHVHEGASDGQYSYHGEGLTGKKDRWDCGVTVHNPQPHDYGVWTCIFGFASGKLKGGFVIVNNQTLFDGKYEGSAAQDTVSVVQGSQVALQCRTQSSIGSCWFTHPDGSYISPHTSTGRKSRFMYAGDGKDLGVCGVQFNATVDDAGQWLCHLGVPDHLDGDISVPIQLHVAVGNLEAETSHLEATIDASVTIGCKSVFNSMPLSICRFIRPDGWGVTFSGQMVVSSVRERYSYVGQGLSKGDCSLRISSVKAIDFGDWKCVAQLDTKSSAEELVQIKLSETAGLSPGGIAAIAILCVVTVLIVGASYLRYKARKQRIPKT